MAKVAILSDYADVTVMLDRLLTPGHQVLTLEKPLAPHSPPAEIPDVVIVPLFRNPCAHARPVEDFFKDIAGGRLLAELGVAMDGHPRPVIIFGIGVTPEEVPDDLLCYAFLTFPQAIQELNPLISGLVGPAASSGKADNGKAEARPS